MATSQDRRVVRPSPARERLLTAADKLFYTRGIDSTGVDAIIEAAGVARMTFYKHFHGKDALVVAYLEERDNRWRQLLKNTWEAAEGTPRAQILAVFDALGICHADTEFRGCSFANAAAELAGDGHPARTVVTHHKSDLRTDLLTLAERGAYANRQELVDLLLMLYEGASTTQALGTVSDAVTKARDAVAQLLDSWPTESDAT